MVFVTFLEAVDGKAPLNIITDQGTTMRAAICIIFPNITHKNCRWHIMDKFLSTIGFILAKNEELNEEFMDCLNHTIDKTWSAVYRGRLSADRCASHERDGDAERHAGLPRFRPSCGRNTLRPALLCYCCLEQCITS
jgi:hypothetical protein